MIEVISATAITLMSAKWLSTWERDLARHRGIADELRRFGHTRAAAILDWMEAPAHACIWLGLASGILWLIGIILRGVL